jgi:hypothetical protein
VFDIVLQGAAEDLFVVYDQDVNRKAPGRDMQES